MKILVAGGAGFIGSNFVRRALEWWPVSMIVVLDRLTYAGNRRNLEPVDGSARFKFVRGDICHPDTVRSVMDGCSWVVNFAAETHVDRSILDARDFVRTNVDGTRVLLEAARDLSVERFVQVSTDEVYGAVPPPQRTSEDAPLQPRSPYSATKAAGDLLVQSFHETFDLPTLITRGANTYGPHQYPEKLIPLFVTNALDNLSLPVYGDGMQVRDWLHVDDHCSGIATVLELGTPGEVYNIDAGEERPNMDVIERIVALTGCDPDLIRHVEDRPGHDRRYALQADKLRSLGWAPEVPFEAGLLQTVRWYRDHRAWWEPLKDLSFAEYYRQQYEHRLSETHS